MFSCQCGSNDMGVPMENAAYLRRQALFCLRLSQLCSDDYPLAEHLRGRAKEYHERALRTEFEAELDTDQHELVHQGVH